MFVVKVTVAELDVMFVEATFEMVRDGEDEGGGGGGVRLGGGGGDDPVVVNVNELE